MIAVPILKAQPEVLWRVHQFASEQPKSFGSATLVVEAEVLRADEVDEAALGGGLDVRVGPSHAARQLRDGVLDVGARVGGEHEAADEALAALEELRVGHGLLLGCADDGGREVLVRGHLVARVRDA